jgi:hypothetical protein
LIRSVGSIYYVRIATVVSVRIVVSIVSVVPAVTIGTVTIVVPAESVDEVGITIIRPSIEVRIGKGGIPIPPGRIVVAKPYSGVAAPSIIVIVVGRGLVSS